MIVYVVRYSEGDYDAYQSWTHIIYDNLEQAVAHIMDSYFDDVIPYRLGSERPFDTKEEALAFHEQYIRLSRDIDTRKRRNYKHWFDEETDAFLGTVDKMWEEGSYVLRLKDVGYSISPVR